MYGVKFTKRKRKKILPITNMSVKGGGSAPVVRKLNIGKECVFWFYVLKDAEYVKNLIWP